METAYKVLSLMTDLYPPRSPANHCITLKGDGLLLTFFWEKVIPVSIDAEEMTLDAGQIVANIISALEYHPQEEAREVFRKAAA